MEHCVLRGLLLSSTSGPVRQTVSVFRHSVQETGRTASLPSIAFLLTIKDLKTPDIGSRLAIYRMCGGGEPFDRFRTFFCHRFFGGVYLGKLDSFQSKTAFVESRFLSFFHSSRKYRRADLQQCFALRDTACLLGDEFRAPCPLH